MPLTGPQKTKVRSALHRAYSAAELPIPVIKPDADAAITNTDTWQGDHKASFNAALPEPYKSAASAEDKTVLLGTVIIADHLVNNPEYLNVLRHILSELEGI